MKIQHFLAALALMGSAHAGTEAPKAPIPQAPAPADSGWWFRAAPYA